jgi:hypothetical protein
MRLLYTSTSLSFTQLIRLTLDRERINYFCSDADSSLAGIGTPMVGGQSRIYVTDDADWTRAVELMREIGAPSGQVEPRPPLASQKQPVWLVFACAALIIALVGFALGSSGTP